MTPPRTLPTRLLLLALAAITLTGCGDVELLSGLNQSDAVKIQVLLTDAGLHADKVEEGRGKVVTWSLVIPGKHATRANALLVKHGVLETRRHLDEKESSLPSEPSARRMRELRRKESDLEETLRRIPDVIWARVHLSVPEPRSPWPGTEPLAEASASVVMSVWKTDRTYTAADADDAGDASDGTGPMALDLLRDDVAAQVAYSVAGLAPEQVAVAVYPVGRETPAHPSTGGGGAVRITPSRLNLLLGGVVALLAALLSVFVRQNHRLAASLRDA